MQLANSTCASVDNDRDNSPYHPCMVYLPTFGWIFVDYMWVNIPSIVALNSVLQLLLQFLSFESIQAGFLDLYMLVQPPQPQQPPPATTGGQRALRELGAAEEVTLMNSQQPLSSGLEGSRESPAAVVEGAVSLLAKSKQKATGIGETNAGGLSNVVVVVFLVFFKAPEGGGLHFVGGVVCWLLLFFFE